MTRQEREQDRVQEINTRVLSLEAQIPSRFALGRAATRVATEIETLEGLGYELRWLRIRGHLLRIRKGRKYDRAKGRTTLD